MTEIIGLEVQFFLTSVLYGVLLLLVYDCLRILRRIVAHNAFFIALEDIIFWVVASIVIFIMIYEKNNGTIRAYAILGMLIGMVLYNQLVSKFIIKWITWVINKIVCIVRKIVSFLFHPFIVLGKRVGKKVHAFRAKVFGIRTKLKRNTRKVGKNSTKQLKCIAKTVKISIKKK